MAKGSEAETGYLERTVVFADIDGFSHMISSMEADEIAPIITNIFSNLSGLTNRFNGQIVGYEGDGVTTQFTSANDGLNFAFAAKSMKMPDLPDARLSLSCGVSTDSTFSSEISPGTFFIGGPAIKKAHLLEKDASTGQVLVDKNTVEKFNKDELMYSPSFVPLSGGRHIGVLSEKKEIILDQKEKRDINVLTYTSPKLAEFFGKPTNKRLTTSIVNLDYLSESILENPSAKSLEQMIKETFGIIEKIIADKGIIGDFGENVQIIYGLDSPIRSANAASKDAEEIRNVLFKLAPSGRISIGFETGFPYVGQVCENVNDPERGTSVLGESVNLAYRITQFLQSQKTGVSQIAFGPGARSRIYTVVKSTPLVNQQFKGFASDVSASLLHETLKGDVKQSKLSRLDDIFVGREIELEELISGKEILEATKGTGIYSIFGESGMGKSTLLDKFMKYIRETEEREKGPLEDKYVVRYAEPVGAEHFSLFRPFLPRKSIEKLDEILTSGRDEPSKIMEGSSLILRELNGLRNSVLCIDYLDKADIGSLHVLKEAVDDPEGRNLLVVYTRPEDRAASLDADKEIRLKGLSQDDSEELARVLYRRFYNQIPPPGKMEALRPNIELTMGHPLAIRELVYNWSSVEKGALATVEDILASSFNSFAEDERNLIGALALNEGEMPWKLLPRIIDTEIGDCVDNLLFRKIVNKSGGYLKLQNKNFQDIAEKTLTTQEKKFLRRRILSTLKEENEGVLEKKEEETQGKYFSRVAGEIDVSQLNWMLNQSLALNDAHGSYDLFRIARQRFSYRDIMKNGEQLLELFDESGYFDGLQTTIRSGELESLINTEEFRLWNEHGKTLIMLGNAYKNTNKTSELRTVAEKLEELCDVFPPNFAGKSDEHGKNSSMKDHFTFLQTALFFARGFVERKEEKFSNARKTFQSALEFFVSNEKELNVPIIYNSLGNMCIFSGDYTEALEFFDLAETEILNLSMSGKELGNELLSIKANKAYAIIASENIENYSYANDIVSAVIDEYDGRADNAKYQGELSEAYLSKAELNWTLSKKKISKETEVAKETAIMDALRARDISEKAYYPRGIATSNLMLSLLVRDEGNARKHYENAMSFIENYSLPEHEIRILEFAREKFEK